MDTRRSFLKKASFIGGAAGINILPSSIQQALAIDPAPGSTWKDAEHIVFLMQENRSFDHTYGTLQGVRGYNDPRAIRLPDDNPVWLQSDKDGNTYAPFRLNIKDTKATWMSSLPHSWSDQVDARNNGKYDKWLHFKPSWVDEYKGMPLTLGYYSREDIPFYYALADAFTVCDQNFCSSLTGTTPNRLHFWTGTIRKEQNGEAKANVWNEDADHQTMVDWTSYPERLQDAGINWKIYQNELYVNVGFEGEEEPWLSNFGDNPLEYLKQYRVKMSPEYIRQLPRAAEKLVAEITESEQKLKSVAAGTEDEKKLQQRIGQLNNALAANKEDQKNYTSLKFENLPAREKAIHEKAFTTNRNDPDYHELDDLKYSDGDIERTMKMPKGDILFQFREDVKNDNLPTVSWLVAPENFSDHPSAAWYGAWYISEVMDILTKNPEVWKKTIFVLTYDENDGYFDHVPPFVAPDPDDPSTGRTTGIHTGNEFVRRDKQTYPDYARVSPIGLGYRVPLVIASPWTRGGWVCSEVFDHTSSLRFLETFLEAKTGKKIPESNISTWRKTICGNLTSAFRQWNGEKTDAPKPVVREPFLESIHNAKFKPVPSNFRKLGNEEISGIRKDPGGSELLPKQEPGIRSSCALSYELYANGKTSADKKTVEIDMSAGSEVFGDASCGSPFSIYAYRAYKNEKGRNWSYTVSAGNSLKEQWPVADFAEGKYHLAVYGPNGFHREFRGSADDPSLEVLLQYERQKGKPAQLTGNVVISLRNTGNKALAVEITDNAYGGAARTINISASGQKGAEAAIVISLASSHNWYDLSVRQRGNRDFEKRFTGRVENGKPGKTDPFMGKVVS